MREITWELTIAALDESNVQRFSLGPNVDAIVFENRRGRNVNYDSLNMAISSLSGRDRIRAVLIDATSTLDRLPILRHFPKVIMVAPNRHLDSFHEIAETTSLGHVDLLAVKVKNEWCEMISGMKLSRLNVISDRKGVAAMVGRCRSLHTLQIRRWCDNDLSRCADLQLKKLIVEGGRLASLTGIENMEIEKVVLKYIRNLQSLSRGIAHDVSIIECNRLDLTSVPFIQGMRRLSLRTTAIMPTVEFASECKSLEHLTIGCPGIREFHPKRLVMPDTLRTLTLATSIAYEHLQMLAMQNPRIAVSDTRTHFVRGRLASSDEFMKVYNT